VQLADDTHVAAMKQVVYDYKIDFVVFDTLARCTIGLNENSSTDMGEFIHNAYELRDTRGEGMTDVLIIHHSGYDTGRSRGSTAIPANVDNSYQVEAEDPHVEITLTTTKRKDGPPHDPMSLRLAEFANSCVVEEAQVGAPDGPTLEGLLDRENGQTIAKLAGIMGLTDETIRKRLKALQEKGKARKEAPTSGKRNEGDLWYLQ